MTDAERAELEALRAMRKRAREMAAKTPLPGEDITGAAVLTARYILGDSPDDTGECERETQL